MSNFISKPLRKKQMKNEVMRSICVCIISATEVILLLKLGGNEVKKTSRCPLAQVASVRCTTHILTNISMKHEDSHSCSVDYQ
jgi:hypothetical protein